MRSKEKIKTIVEQFIAENGHFSTIYNNIIYGVFATLFAKENLVLYGEGGFGKSFFVNSVLEFLQKEGFINSFKIKACGVGSTLDELLGGIDLPALNSQGKFKYSTKYSIFNHDVVVLEEGFDMPAKVLESLKDIISRKEFDNHKFGFDSIIVCTNVNPNALAVNASMAALMERFAVKIKFGWKDYSVKNYINAFSNKYAKIKIRKVYSFFGAQPPRTFERILKLYEFMDLMDIAKLMNIEINNESLKLVNFEKEFDNAKRIIDKTTKKQKLLEIYNNLNEFIISKGEEKEEFIFALQLLYNVLSEYIREQ